MTTLASEPHLGVVEYYRDDTQIQVKGPARSTSSRSRSGLRQGRQARGIEHSGFRLTDPTDIDLAVREVEKAGGRLLRRGEFGPGLPFAYVADPDGYQIEIWYE